MCSNDPCSRAYCCMPLPCSVPDVVCHVVVRRQGCVVVEVEARVTKPEAVDSFLSNTFTFVYQLRASHPGGAPLRLRRVLPTCEEEAMRSWRACQLTGMGAS